MAMAACGPALPDDLDALMQKMNENDMRISVAAANKMEEVYGKNGLVAVLSRGGSQAKAMSANRLRKFSDETVEQALMNALQERSNDADVRAQVLGSLETIGSMKSLKLVEASIDDTDTHVSYRARQAASAIRARTGQKQP